MNYGWHLVQSQIIATFPFMRSLVVWILRSVQLYQSCTHSLDAIQCQHLEVEARKQPGRYDKYFQMSQMPLNTFFSWKMT